MLYDQLTISIYKNSSGFYQVRVAHDDLIPEGGAIESAPITPEKVAEIRGRYDAMVKRVREVMHRRQTTAAYQNTRLWEIVRQLQSYPVGDTEADLIEMRRLCERFLAQWDGPAPALPLPVDYSAMLEIGRSMGKIFPGASPELLRRSLMRAQTATPERGLCVIIEVAAMAQEVLDLPWELLIVEEDQVSNSASFLLFEHNVVLMRQIRNIGTSRSIEIARPLSSQVFVVQPVRGAPIDAQLFRDALDPVHADQPLDAWWSTAPDTLRVMRERLARYNPQLVQLVCHGRHSLGSEMTRSDMLLTYVDNGKTIMHRVSPHDLLQVLQAAPALQVVLLTVCDSGRSNGSVRPTSPAPDTERTVSVSNIAYELVRGGVPMVIAMQEKISQGAAAEFSQVFYQYLQTGAPIERALTEARSALQPSRWGMDWTMPVVYRGHEEIEQFKWYQRSIDRLETAVFAPRQRRAFRSKISAFAVLLLVASSARLLWPSSLDPNIPLLLYASLIWAAIGMITPLFVVLLLHTERQHISDPKQRRAIWWTHLGGTSLGYFGGGITLTAVTPLFYLIGEWLPVQVWWLILAGIIGWSLLFSVVIARSLARGAQANFDLYPKLYGPSTWVLLCILMPLAGVLIPIFFIPMIFQMLFELAGPSGLGFLVGASILSMVYLLQSD